MGHYGEYLDRQMSFQELTLERKRQLVRISELRGGRDVLVFAADMNKANAPISIGYADILPQACALDSTTHYIVVSGYGRRIPENDDGSGAAV